jgi:lactate racemase
MGLKVGKLMQISIPYGSGIASCNIPSKTLLPRNAQPTPKGIRDIAKAVGDAIENPIGTDSLLELVRPSSSVSIVVNDITRPYITEKLLSPIIQTLHQAGVTDKLISIVVATGVHRSNTQEELKKLLGGLPSDIRVINHIAKDEKSLIKLGTTKRRMPVIINKNFAESDIKILTGLISPHQQAGFSGGRKSILPGISSYDTIKAFHSAPLCSREVEIGKLDGNITHEESLEAARIAKVDFIVNVVHTSQWGILKVVAGDLYHAWSEGVKLWKESMEVKITELADISIVSPGGYPRDINLWQAQKAIASAELVTRKGGIIILVAQCKEGLGEEQLSWQQLLVEARTPIEAIERFEREGYNDGSGKAFLFARALKDFHVMIVSDFLDPVLLKRMFMERFINLQDAVNTAISETGGSSKIVVLPDAVEYLPSVSRNGV